MPVSTRSSSKAQSVYTYEARRIGSGPILPIACAWSCAVYWASSRWIRVPKGAGQIMPIFGFDHLYGAEAAAVAGIRFCLRQWMDNDVSGDAPEGVVL